MVEWELKIKLKEAYDNLPVKDDDELTSMTGDELGEYLDLLEEKKEFEDTNKIMYFKPDDWVDRLTGKMNDQGMCSIIASNRSGKSYSTTWLTACHLIGWYPDDYDGLRYENGIDAWIMSPTAENYVQAGGLQEYLLGKQGAQGTGWIPEDCIVKVEQGIGTKGFIKKIYVQHSSGSISSIEYKSYSQGQHVLMGGSVDLIVIDEEPRDTKIVGQCATRVSQAKSGKGRVLLCFTPENGMTEVVSSCFEGQWKDGCERITVYDVSFITPEKIEQMKKNIPEREHNMRLLGIPSIGSGAVFPQLEHEIKFMSDEVEIQPHWKVAAAIDFGYLPDPCCILFGAYDPDGGKIYVFREFYETERTPTEIAGWIKHHAPTMPIIFPADGRKKQLGGSEAVSLQEQFIREGINMRDSYRVDYGKGFRREDGHSQLRRMFREGTLKISNLCTGFFKEFRVYQYDDKGKTEHCQDHAIDCLRYLMQKIDKVGIPWADAQKHTHNYSSWGTNRKMTSFTNNY